MDGIIAALQEWRAARQAFPAVPPISTDPKQRFPQAIWERLAHAEDRLMKLAASSAWAATDDGSNRAESRVAAESRDASGSCSGSGSACWNPDLAGR